MLRDVILHQTKESKENTAIIREQKHFSRHLLFKRESMILIYEVTHKAAIL